MKKSGNYKIPPVLGVTGPLLMISSFFYSAYVDAAVGRGSPDDISASWVFVWALYRFTPAGVIALTIALFMAFAEKISNIPSSDD